MGAGEGSLATVTGPSIFSAATPPDTLRHLSHHLLLMRQPYLSFRVARHLCAVMCSVTPAHELSCMDRCHAWLRLADAGFALEMHKLAMLAYARVLCLLPPYAVRICPSGEGVVSRCGPTCHV